MQVHLKIVEFTRNFWRCLIIYYSPVNLNRSRVTNRLKLALDLSMKNTRLVIT